MPKLRTDLVQDCKIIEEVCEDLDDEFLRQHLGVEDLTKIDYLELKKTIITKIVIIDFLPLLAKFSFDHQNANNCENKNLSKFSKKNIKFFLSLENYSKKNRFRLIVCDEDQRVNSIGENMPHLERLKLNDSSVPSLRDLGTCLTNLKVLWLNRSGLQDVGGISGLPLLEELYIAFNDVTELAPMAYHDTIHTIDLEGNNIEGESELQYLDTC